MYAWHVSEDAKGQRLDAFIVANLPGLSRSSIQKLIAQGAAKVNGKTERSSTKLHVNQAITLDFDPESITSIPEIELPILYEDEDCIVINKPTGLLTHSKGAFNPEATIATFIAPKLQSMAGDRAGIVHRLDRATSGVIIAAKNETALAWLQKQFSSRKAHKTYVAIVEGSPEPAEAVIEIPIERNPKKPQQFRGGSQGKGAVTAYKVTKQSPKYSLLELYPKTGRTHQLRVHLEHIKHPIVGDTLYGGAIADRLYLHAYKLEITIPSGERKTFEAPVPKEFGVIMKQS